MELTQQQKQNLIETAKTLKGHERRRFMAETVKAWGAGGQRFAERELGWNRGTIRKGMRELESGFICVDAYSARGRKRIEEHLPELRNDITDIMDRHCGHRQNGSAEGDRVRCLSAAQVRRYLITEKGYTDEQLPTAQTINTRLNELGYTVNRKR